MNPCPCGFFGNNSYSQQCRCTPHQIMRYRTKISGPLLDRIDIHIEVPAVKPSELIQPIGNDSSREIKERAERARRRQLDRFLHTDIYFNSRMNHKQIKIFCRISEPARQLLKQAINELDFSARAYDKILKVSRTISDLDEQDEIQAEHIAEAIQYRNLDRNLWL